MKNGIAPVVRNLAKEALARNECFSSMSIKLCTSVEIVGVAKAAGFEAILIDMEHNAFSLSTTNQLSCAALAHNITCLVRVPANEPQWISRCLDGGATGVIVPHVSSVEEAKAAVRAARFPPLGTRSAVAGLPHYNYAHLSAPVANQICNDGTLVTVMIEDQAGLDCVDEIATLDGIDLILIGTNDLTAELGVPGDYDSPLISAAYSKVISAARRNGKHAGVGGINSRMDLVKKFVEEGARFVMAGTDLPFLLGAARKRGAEMAEIREWTAVKAQEEPKTNGVH
ncbi:HpcH/HpaI aldolase family protein [Rhodotorula paludigena]|uniref:HpcH/HpaI aldolase family protein n=1 Tax=Rhodotorula paludigena TaxID=86838 RepID=UPI00317CBA14